MTNVKKENLPPPPPSEILSGFNTDYRPISVNMCFKQKVHFLLTRPIRLGDNVNNCSDNSDCSIGTTSCM